MPAFVGLVSSVCSDVLLQVGELGKLPLTDLAAVGLDAQVDAHVLGEVRAVCEGFAALGTLVRLRFSHVHLGVQLQVRFRSKNLKQKTWLKLYKTNFSYSPPFPKLLAEHDLCGWGGKLIIGKPGESGQLLPVPFPTLSR